MGQYTSYYLYQKYEQRGEQEAIPVYPNVYSIDADGTRERVVKIQDDPQCGYDPPVKPIYKWVNIPITQDYVCDDCPEYQTRWVRTDETTCVKEGPDPQYRWVNMDASVDYYCEGTTKYYKQKKQVSYDDGQTWQDVTPLEYQKGGVAEEQSTDCGYVPPTTKKYVATYIDGTTREVECNSSGTLTSGETHHNPEEIRSAVIGNCVRAIGNEAFYFCRRLTGITIPNSVTSIGSSAFTDCYSLPSINIPNRVTSIDQYAFYNCSGLTSCTIGTGVTSIGHGAFCYCIALTSVTIPNSVTSIGEYTFNECYNLTSIVIPNSVTSIGEYAFEDCTSLTSCTIGTGVTTIGKYAFAYCSGLTSITIPDSVTSIDQKAFLDCDGLTSITIPNSVTSIGREAFVYCDGLTSATIGTGVTSIGGMAFSNCDNLTSITVLATTPPTLGGRPFGFTNNCPIYVPAASVDAYKSAKYWSDYASRIKPIP